MSRWKRFSPSANGIGIAALVLAPVACSLGDFDSLGAGVDQNIGGSAGRAGSAGASGGGSSGSAGTSGSGGSGGDGGTAGAGGTGEPTNLIPNGNFDRGSSNWTAIGNCRTQIVPDEGRSGTSCLLTTDRNMAVWEGPSLNLRTITSPGETYSITVWVRAQADGSDAGAVSYPVGLTQKSVCATTGELYDPLTSGTVTSTDWTELTVSFITPDCSDLQESLLYVEGPPVGANFYIDDTSLLLTPL